MALIAYDLGKSSFQEAERHGGRDLRLMSFKGALDTTVSNAARHLRREEHALKIREIWTLTVEKISGKAVHFRPIRHEPDVQKNRPEPFSYLTKPRDEYKEIPHRGRSRLLACYCAIHSCPRRYQRGGGVVVQKQESGK